MRTIALERGLEGLKQALDERGYTTVFVDEISTPVSVLIYQDQNALEQTSLHSSLNNYMHTESNSVGVLLIPAGDNTADQIIAMIDNRLYSPLFYY